VTGRFDFEINLEQISRMRTGLLSICVAMTACGPGPMAPAAEGASFGHFEVTAKSEALAGLDPQVPWTATVGGIAAYEVARVDGKTVKLTVQGHPEGGAQPIVITARRSSVEVGTVQYAAPLDQRFSKLVAFGASLTMGSQDASISMRSQLHGPAAVVARQMGAYLAMPLIKTGFLPALTVADIDPLRCRPTAADIFGTIGARAQAELIPKLKDQSGNIVIGKMRVDPNLVATNVAIGGFRVAETVGGAKSFFGTILEHVIWDAKVDTAGLINPPAETQLDRIAALKPTIAISTDLFGNDYNNVNLHTDGIPDLSALTPVDELRASLRVLLTRLDATGAEVFVATGPDNTVLPMYPEKVARLKAAGFSEATRPGGSPRCAPESSPTTTCCAKRRRPTRRFTWSTCTKRWPRSCPTVSTSAARCSTRHRSEACCRSTRCTSRTRATRCSPTRSSKRSTPRWGRRSRSPI
jgi:hypothetical protein